VEANVTQHTGNQGAARTGFAYIDADGGEHLPMRNEAEVRESIAKYGQTDFASVTAKEEARQKLIAAAARHGIEISPDSDLARVAKVRHAA
jgi:hypothetical protein